MNAIDIADSLVSEFHADSLNFGTTLNAAAELRRLAAIEQKYLAIMALEPSAWAAVFADYNEVCEMFSDERSAICWIDSDDCLWDVEKKPLYTLPKD